jgi:hypothetical protein
METWPSTKKAQGSKKIALPGLISCRAANHGNARAQYFVGNMYHLNHGFASSNFLCGDAKL